jgi:hypothetical protein
MDERDKSDSEDSVAHSAEDIEAAISKLSKSDRVGKASELLNIVGGAAAGASAAGAVAGAAGATTILGSSTLAGALGGFVVASTPVGWIAGCVIAGGAAAYGVSKMIKSGGMNDQIRTDMVGRLNTRLQKLLQRSEAAEIPAAEAFREYVDLAVADKSISAEQARRIVALVEGGKLDAGLAIKRIKHMKAAA